MEQELERQDISEVILTPDSIISRNPSFTAYVMDDELACVNEEMGACIGLNVTGRMIWEMLETPLPIQAIIDQMLEAFPEDKDVIPLEMIQFIASLTDLSIITADNRNGPNLG